MYVASQTSHYYSDGEATKFEAVVLVNDGRPTNRKKEKEDPFICTRDEAPKRAVIREGERQNTGRTSNSHSHNERRVITGATTKKRNNYGRGTVVNTNDYSRRSEARRSCNDSCGVACAHTRSGHQFLFESELRRALAKRGRPWYSLATPSLPFAPHTFRAQPQIARSSGVGTRLG